jgi:hypothetical protein
MQQTARDINIVRKFSPLAIFEKVVCWHTCCSHIRLRKGAAKKKYFRQKLCRPRVEPFINPCALAIRSQTYRCRAISAHTLEQPTTPCINATNSFSYFNLTFSTIQRQNNIVSTSPKKSYDTGDKYGLFNPRNQSYSLPLSRPSPATMLRINSNSWKIIRLGLVRSLASHSWNKRAGIEGYKFISSVRLELCFPDSLIFSTLPRILSFSIVCSPRYTLQLQKSTIPSNNQYAFLLP